MKRRKFLQGSMASMAASGAVLNSEDANAAISSSWIHRFRVPEVFRRDPRPPQHSKALIIGSGFGGAISALRLAKAGIQTTVLERGMRWPTNTPWRETFARDMAPDGRAFWFSSFNRDLLDLPHITDRFAGVMDVDHYTNLDVWRAACMGGGSVVFTGVMIQPEKSYFEKIFPNSVDYNQLNDVYFPRVREMLNLNGIPDDLYNDDVFAHSRSWNETVINAGYQPKSCDSIFNWDVIRAELRGERRYSAIIGETTYGNSNGAKFDLNQNYIKYAEATGKARFYAGKQVESITFENGRYVVEIRDVYPTGFGWGTYRVTADHLFMAAGSVGTTKLLVKAREKGQLPNLNQHIGEGWGSNGDALVSRSFSRVDGFLQSSPCVSRIDDNSFGHFVTLENWHTPGLMFNTGITGSLGMVMTSDRGRFTYNRYWDEASLSWSADNNRRAEQAIRTVHNKVIAANGGLPGLPLFRRDVNANFTAHPLGGAVLGKATDAFGRVEGYKGLYVMDGAMIPGSTGAVNPSLTISALAERNIESILLKDFS